MSGGYMGKILRLNLTTGSIGTIDTLQYADKFVGGHGIGSALFWDLCTDKTIDGLDTKNVCTLMTSPLAGTLAPGCSRVEVQAIGTFGYPTKDGVRLHCNPFFNRSNFGGRFANQLKFAGWDGIVLEGRATSPVWVHIINDRVEIRDATTTGDALWGMDTWQTQWEIWRISAGNKRFARYGDWLSAGASGALYLNRPAVVCIGQAGEVLSRMAALVHEGGCSAGNGGMGAVWGSKNLKAISVIGTGSVSVADPKALMDARQWMIKEHGYDIDKPVQRTPTTAPYVRTGYGSAEGEGGRNRFVGCDSCFTPCRRRYQSGQLVDSHCQDSWYMQNAPAAQRIQAGTKEVTDWTQRYGFDVLGLSRTINYARALDSMGILGPGKSIESRGMPIEGYGTPGYPYNFMTWLLARKDPLANDMVDGAIRFAAKIGRLMEDLSNGTLQYPDLGHLNSPAHWTFPGGCFSYGGLVGERDINEHDFIWTMRVANPFAAVFSPEQHVNMLAKKTVPYTDDPFMFDWGHGDTGIYSKSRAKLISWHRHETRFWKQSVLYCDWLFAWFVNTNRPDFSGPTPEAEPKFFSAVTGRALTYAQGVEIGKRIWNLDRAIWTLQGKHRDLEKYSGYMYTKAGIKTAQIPEVYPVYMDKKWQYWTKDDFIEKKPLFLPSGVEQWKDYFYDQEGWELGTGWPTRKTMEALDLKSVANELERQGKLGKDA
jgi:aldehyde:ferredoxin oxidoreductase